MKIFNTKDKEGPIHFKKKADEIQGTKIQNSTELLNNTSGNRTFEILKENDFQLRNTNTQPSQV